MQETILMDFSNIECVEKTAEETFNAFHAAINNKEFKYDDIESALSRDAFLKVLDDWLSHDINKDLVTKELKEIERDYKLIRGVIIKKPIADTAIGYDRIMPNRAYMKNDNRFSPHGVEWLYIAMGKHNPMVALECSKTECQIEKYGDNGEEFAYCSFSVSEFAKNRKVIDLTIAADESFDEINKRYINKLNNMKWLTDCTSQIISIIANGRDEIDINELFRELSHNTTEIGIKIATTEWLVYTYLKIMSKHFFKRIEAENNAEKAEKYAPYHCLAMYFMSKGFDGIIYSSSVYPEGKNIVLFNCYALPNGQINRMPINRQDNS